MSFRDYATRIKAHAVAAAKKIPTFDEMAANDEYIHSEEFHFRRQKRETTETSGYIDRPSSTIGVRVDADDTSSMGSWSLLDRPSGQVRSCALQVTKATFEPSSTRAGSQPYIEPAPVSSNTSLSSETPSGSILELKSISSSSLPLLSVVANALEDTPLQNVDTENSRHALDNNQININEETYSDSESDDSETDEECNDPIMSLIRNSKPHEEIRSKHRTIRTNSSNKSQKRMSNKSPQRFMHDIDEKICRSPNDRIETGLPSSSSVKTGKKLPFLGWMQEVTKSSFHRILSRSEGPSDTVLSCNLPPLARERQQQSKVATSFPEDYQKAVSTSVLGQEELALLAKMTNPGSMGPCSALSSTIREYRNFAFIIFTLILAILVYFFQKSEDGVS